MEDKNHLFPVRFGYDYIGKRGLDIKSFYMKMNDHIKSLKFLQTDYKKTQNQFSNANLLNANAIEIHPLTAGLLLFSGLQFFWQSKHWKMALKKTTELLEEFAKNK